MRDRATRPAAALSTRAQRGVFVAWLVLAACGWAADVQKPGPAEPRPQPRRPAAWAQPLKRPGLPNLHKVSGGLYRGAQPTAEGMRELKKLGVKTVVSLRTFHSDRAMIGDTGLAYVHLRMTPLAVSDAAVAGFLKRVADKKRQPVFVHCLHGADRTGVLCAAYRIVVQGWSRDEAIREMTTGGFGHHKLFANLTAYLRKADFDAIRRKAGLAKPTSPD